MLRCSGLGEEGNSIKGFSDSECPNRMVGGCYNYQEQKPAANAAERIKKTGF